MKEKIKAIRISKISSPFVLEVEFNICFGAPFIYVFMHFQKIKMIF